MNRTLLIVLGIVGLWAAWRLTVRAKVIKIFVDHGEDINLAGQGGKLLNTFVFVRAPFSDARTVAELLAS